MKKLKINLLLISVIVYSVTKLEAQQNVGYELLLGGSFLSNTHLSANKPLSDPKTLSGSFTTYGTIGSGAFKIKSGIGISVQTFGLSKKIESVSGHSVFTNFQAGQKYNYSYLQQVFVEVPLGVEQTIPICNSKNSVQVEAGGVAGYRIYCEKQFQLKSIDGNMVTVKSNSVEHLNPLRYGVYMKWSYGKANAEKKAGIVYSLSGNYYFNDVFTRNNSTPGKSFSIMIGAAVFINKNSNQ